MPPVETVLKAALSHSSEKPVCSICPPGLPKLSKHPVTKIKAGGRRGFNTDKKYFLALYGREWASIEDFQAWFLNEQRVHGVKFVVFESLENTAPLGKRRWLAEHTFSCSRYQPSEPRYVGPPKPRKNTCFCSIRVKTYPDTPIVRGSYNDFHSHPLGKANVTFSEKLLSFVSEKMSLSTRKSDAPSQTDDVYKEPTKDCDSSVDAWRPESALYLDIPDPFAPRSMIDPNTSYIED
ncbi:uncharacterized protein BT62DRAFT_924071 [Guyanagaster necrorhizus]|uniref:Uncharacterized protein n=1 Tax=Guyanagaster necrorhizus TaxID=856835 RepID=A0A9P7VG88_9AGAR|nr:uncharacterized protein BT62DRAFT_924071 [Guyanagaster necrorhizus MCA 3950]KAG7440401.1 hypothetical protein BT62DRAFT_924071 [Guyanagaster necrorhizus MCA 3950]